MFLSTRNRSGGLWNCLHNEMTAGLALLALNSQGSRVEVGTSKLVGTRSRPHFRFPNSIQEALCDVSEYLLLKPMSTVKNCEAFVRQHVKLTGLFVQEDRTELEVASPMARMVDSMSFCVMARPVMMLGSMVTMTPL